MNRPKLGIVVPCYNEELVLSETYSHLENLLAEMIFNKKIDGESFIIFVDDGSKDGTWSLIRDLNSKNPVFIKGIKLSRNFGHQNALLAGLMEARKYADCIVSIDADLQQDEKAIVLFVDKYLEGYEIIFGIRKNRNSDSFFKRNTALIFYQIMKFFGVNIIKNHADYRLIDYGHLNVPLMT